MGSDPGQEGSPPTQVEDDSTTFWGDDQGPVVMVWDGMLLGEQERAKKIIGGEKDWIICRVKPPKGQSGDRTGGIGNGQSTTDFLEQYGTRLVLVSPRVPYRFYDFP